MPSLILDNPAEPGDEEHLRCPDSCAAGAPCERRLTPPSPCTGYSGIVGGTRRGGGCRPCLGLQQPRWSWQSQPCKAPRDRALGVTGTGCQSTDAYLHIFFKQPLEILQKKVLMKRSLIIPEPAGWRCSCLHKQPCSTTPIGCSPAMVPSITLY